MSKCWESRFYVLRDRIAFPADDWLDAMMADRSEWRVAETTIGDCALRVSTVFLGYDHNHRDEGMPLLFETMVFLPEGTASRMIVRRYSTWADAEAGHAVVVRLATAEHEHSVERSAGVLERLIARVAAEPDVRS